MIQFYINSEIFCNLCRRWVGDREYLPYNHRINLSPLGKFGDYFLKYHNYYQYDGPRKLNHIWMVN